MDNRASSGMTVNLTPKNFTEGGREEKRSRATDELICIITSIVIHSTRIHSPDRRKKMLLSLQALRAMLGSFAITLECERIDIEHRISQLSRNTEANESQAVRGSGTLDAISSVKLLSRARNC